MKKDKINISSLSLGSDPEILLFSELENKPVTVIGLVGGTKSKPIPITDKGHAIQEDGVAVEFNIPPCSTKEEYVENINFVKNYIIDTIAKPNNLVLLKEASAVFTDEQLACKEAQEIGCTPDINAWEMTMNSPEGYSSNLRAVGGHVHLGYEGFCEEYSLELVHLMDLFLGVGSVLLDKDTQRRVLYGKAGAMRFTKFGLEYRVLSNFWIFDDKLIEWVFENTIKAVEYFNAGGTVTNPEDIQKCINTCDKQLALEIIEDYNIPMPESILKEMEYARAD
jgi:hypothetical protein